MLIIIDKGALRIFSKGRFKALLLDCKNAIQSDPGCSIHFEPGVLYFERAIMRVTVTNFEASLNCHRDGQGPKDVTAPPCPSQVRTSLKLWGGGGATKITLNSP